MDRNAEKFQAFMNTVDHKSVSFIDLLSKYCKITSALDSSSSNNHEEISITRLHSINASYVSIIKASFFSDVNNNDMHKIIVPKLGVFLKKLVVGNDYDDSNVMTMIPMTLVQLSNYIEQNEL